MSAVPVYLHRSPQKEEINEKWRVPATWRRDFFPWIFKRLQKSKAAKHWTDHNQKNKGTEIKGSHLRRTFMYCLHVWIKYGVRSPNFIWGPVYSSTHWLRSRNYPHTPRIWAHIRGRYWSAKDRPFL